MVIFWSLSVADNSNFQSFCWEPPVLLDCPFACFNCLYRIIHIQTVTGLVDLWKQEVLEENTTKFLPEEQCRQRHGATILADVLSKCAFSILKCSLVLLGVEKAEWKRKESQIPISRKNCRFHGGFLFHFKCCEFQKMRCTADEVWVLKDF